MRKASGISTLLLLVGIFAGCSISEVAEPSPRTASTSVEPSIAPTDDYPMFTKWIELTETQRDEVCMGVLKRGGPDRSDTTAALTSTGVERTEAQDMYPYVVNQCMARGL